MTKRGEPQRWLESVALKWESDKCLSYPFSIGGEGYGEARINKKRTLAHRFVCGAAHGSAPAGRQAAHSCGNRWCVNKRHLSWKTPKGNCEDRDRHGTTARGERMGSAKLNEEQVIAIRASNGSYRSIAAQYGVSFGLVGNIKRRSRWGWL